MALWLLHSARPYVGLSLQVLGRQWTSGKSPSTILAVSLQKNNINNNTVFEQRRHYAMRLELNEHGIKWRRPQYVPSWKPEKSGDLETHVEPDISRPPLKLKAAIDAFEQADEMTKNYLSIKFCNHKEAMKLVRHDKIKEVQRHKYDTGSMECEVAALTVKIRNLQATITRDKKFLYGKSCLIELIARRKKLLKHLRRMDYKRFEWLVEKLNLQYKPFPMEYHWITRKDSLRKLVQMHKEEIITNRLEEYKKILKSQEEDFLKEKEETLRWIAETEAELGVSSNSGTEEPAVAKS